MIHPCSYPSYYAACQIALAHHSRLIPVAEEGNVMYGRVLWHEIDVKTSHQRKVQHLLCTKVPIRARFVVRREAREKGRKFGVVQGLHGPPGLLFIYCSTRSYFNARLSFVGIHESDIHLDNSKSNLILESKDTAKSH